MHIHAFVKPFLWPYERSHVILERIKCIKLARVTIFMNHLREL